MSFKRTKKNGKSASVAAKPEVKVLNFTSPLTSAPYNPKDFGDLFAGSVVLSLGGASVCMERIVHHPIGGHTLLPSDWVISSRNEITNLLRTKDNPFTQEISKSVWQQCLGVLVERKLAAVKKVGTTKETYLVGNGKEVLLEVARKAAKAYRATIMADLDGMKPIKKAGPPPKMPSIEVDVLMGFQFRAEPDGLAKAVAGVQLASDKGLKSAFVKSLPKSPHRSYTDDMNEREQAAVADFKGVSDRDIMPAIMKKFMGVQQKPVAGKTALVPPPPPDKGDTEEKKSYSMEEYGDMIAKLGEAPMTADLKSAYLSDEKLKEKVAANIAEGEKFLEDVQAYGDLYDEYKTKAEAAAAERKKRYEQYLNGASSEDDSTAK